MTLPNYIVIPAAVPANRIITPYAFRTRVTDELVAQMELDAMHNPADPEPVQKAKALARARMARVFAASVIDLENPELVAGFAGAPQEVRDRIFVAPVLDTERP
jgi:hypothetical protein